MPTLLQQGHADGQFLFTIFSAFYFPSIQLKIITFKKKSNFRYKNLSSSQTDLLCSLYQSFCAAVWYFSCRQGPFFKTLQHLRADNQKAEKRRGDKRRRRKTQMEMASEEEQL